VASYPPKPAPQNNNEADLDALYAEAFDIGPASADVAAPAGPPPSPEQIAALNQEEARAKRIMFLAVASGLFVLTVVALIVVSLISTINNTQQNNVSDAYNLENRSLPAANVDSVRRLLPATLGEFSLESVRGSLQDFSAVYRRNDDRISIVGSQAVSLAAAQGSVKIVLNALLAGPTPTSLEQRIIDSDMRYSYVLVVGAAQTQFAYNHDRWFFNISTVSKSTLDSFMAVFPY
jgi:hypothetical protein